MSKKTKQIVIRSSKDTRGLPAYLDPRKFYEYSTQQRHKQADGLEGLLYKLLPSTLWSSLAFAIDPFSQLKTALGRISPTTRHRIRSGTSVLDLRKQAFHRYTRVHSHGGIASPVVVNSVANLTSQLPLPWDSDDTTRRMRVPGSSQGEFSSWKTRIESPGRTVRSYYQSDGQYSDSHLGIWHDYHYILREDKSWTWLGSSARILPTTVSALRTQEFNLATALMQSHGLSMFKGILPTHRQYTLFRNIVELKDIPRAVLQLRTSLQDLSRLYDSIEIPNKVRQRVAALGTTLKDVPKEWLSYSFGWRQTYSDLVNLLAAPQRIGRKIDLLIRRGSKPTTYRSKRTYASTSTASSGFIYESVTPPELTPVVEHSVSRSTELRMVLNATIEFPGVDLPRLRSTEFYRQLGVTPSFTDMYNLVPWTWLIDWFSGLGDYVEVIDNINNSPDLINWGLLTAEVQGALRSDYRSKSTNTSAQWVGAGPGFYDVTKLSWNHTSNLHYNLHLRKDLAGLLDVSVATDMASLTPFQQSILGALLSTRIVFRR